MRTVVFKHLHFIADLGWVRHRCFFQAVCLSSSENCVLLTVSWTSGDQWYLCGKKSVETCIAENYKRAVLVWGGRASQDPIWPLLSHDDPLWNLCAHLEGSLFLLCCTFLLWENFPRRTRLCAASQGVLWHCRSDTSLCWWCAETVGCFSPVIGIFPRCCAWLCRLSVDALGFDTAGFTGSALST